MSLGQVLIMISNRKRKTVSTLGGRSSFDFAGSVHSGVKLWYGKEKKNQASVSSDQFDALLRFFSQKTVLVGNGRRNRPVGSIGAWLQEHVTRAVIASYIAKILVEEEFVQKLDGAVVRFNRYPVRPKRRLKPS